MSVLVIGYTYVSDNPNIVYDFTINSLSKLISFTALSIPAFGYTLEREKLKNNVCEPAKFVFFGTVFGQINVLSWQLLVRVRVNKLSTSKLDSRSLSHLLLHPMY